MKEGLIPLCYCGEIKPRVGMRYGKRALQVEHCNHVVLASFQADAKTLHGTCLTRRHFPAKRINRGALREMTPTLHDAMLKTCTYHADMYQKCQ